MIVLNQVAEKRIIITVGNMSQREIQTVIHLFDDGVCLYQKGLVHMVDRIALLRRIILHIEKENQNK